MTAERNKVSKPVVDLLMQHGGKPSELARVEERGELFGNAADANAKSEQRRATEKATKDAKVADAAAKADSAKGNMGDNMNALHIRGQKINELGEKTQELEENAKQYGSLASQLKDKVKAKKWYQL
jgi:syntaxin-binding protein 5